MDLKAFFFWHKIYIRRTLCIEMFWENSIETSILSRVRQIISPGWMHETSAQGWCTGKTQRNGMGWRGRWEGGSGWGTHVNPWLIHVNVWQKPLQYCKVISLQLIKINGKKTKKKNKQKEGPCTEGTSLMNPHKTSRTQLDVISSIV